MLKEKNAGSYGYVCPLFLLLPIRSLKTTCAHSLEFVHPPQAHARSLAKITVIMSSHKTVTIDHISDCRIRVEAEMPKHEYYRDELEKAHNRMNESIAMKIAEHWKEKGAN